MKIALFRLIRPLVSRFWLVTRAMTLGVRGAVFDAEGRILLVKHSYVDGWHLPGGGVEVGETAVESLSRELFEEANITLTGVPQLHGLFHQPLFSRRDHVAVYVVRNFDWAGKPDPNAEIVDCQFFRFDALPEDTTPATRRRLVEIVNRSPMAAQW